MSFPDFDDDYYDPSQQLLDTLRTSVTSALSTRRPLLTHLNADTTWLLSIPYPSANPRKRIYYHVLIDPWFRGGQSDVAKFFSQQWHKEESFVQTIQEVEEAIMGIEDVARGDSEDASPDNDEVDVIAFNAETKGHGKEKQEKEGDNSNWIDAVLISHEFTDHMHKDTLLEISSAVPVFATSKAASAIRSWLHFTSVFDIPRFDGDWRSSSTSPLPSWIGVSQVAYPGVDLLYYHSAILVTFSSTTPPEEAEAIIYTPHGISPENVAPVAQADPKIQTLALLHGLQDVQIKARFTVDAQLNKGAHNGLKVQRLLKAKYWVGTHDEVKTGGGIVSWFLDRKAISLGEAMEREKGELEGDDAELGEVRFEELRNGESLILD